MKKWFAKGVLMLCSLLGSYQMQAKDGIVRDTLGDAESMRKARSCIESGDWEQAYSYFACPALHGNAEALYYEGYLYESGRLFGSSDKKAIVCYRKAAAKGHEEAQFSLANLYYNSGVDSCYEEAVHYYRMGAERGDARSQWALGRMYENGCGVTKTLVEAFRWYLKAARQGLDRACYSVGQMYAAGQGVDSNRTEAAKWFLQAADGCNYAKAQYRLGMAYIQGEGVPHDTVEACYWLRRAAQNTDDYSLHEEAEKELRALGLWKEEWYLPAWTPDTVVVKDGQKIGISYPR